MTLTLTPDPNQTPVPGRNLNAIPIPHLRNAECVKLQIIVLYYCKIELNPDPQP